MDTIVNKDYYYYIYTCEVGKLILTGIPLFIVHEHLRYISRDTMQCFELLQGSAQHD